MKVRGGGEEERTTLETGNLLDCLSRIRSRRRRWGVNYCNCRDHQRRMDGKGNHPLPVCPAAVVHFSVTSWF